MTLGRVGPVVAFFALLLGAACDDGPHPPANHAQESPEAEAIPVSAYFPAHLGDRWRVRVGDRDHVQGVSAVDERGHAVLVGTDQIAPRRFRIEDDAVTEVTPSGAVVVPWLRAPLREGASWEYARPGAERTTCEGTVTAAGRPRTTAGATFHDCVEVHHRCRYPEGSRALPAPFTHVTTTIYCAGVGRVEEESHVEASRDAPSAVHDAPTPGSEPAPDAKPSADAKPSTGADRPKPPRATGRESQTARALARHLTLVSWRVAGSPARPSGASCAQFLLLPTDVQAACGPALSSEEPAGTPTEHGCRFEYTSDAGRVVVETRRRTSARAWLGDGHDAAPERVGDVFRTQSEHTTALAFDAAPGAAAIAKEEPGPGAVTLGLRADRGACAPDHLARLVPTLRSLLR